MPLESVISRLKTQVTQLKAVGGSAELSAIDEQIRKLPAAFVLPAAESGEPNAYANEDVLQRVNVQFAIALVVRNVSDSAGRKVLEDLKTVRTAVKSALIGYSPLPDYAPIEFRSGRVVRFDDDAVLWWLDEYSTVFYERGL